MNDFISDEIKKIIKKHGTTSAIELTKLCGCNIIYTDLDEDMLGFTVTNNRCNTIVIHNDLEEHIQTFVILHELGHVRLHKGISTPFFKRINGNNYIPKIEKEANEFAFAILCKDIENVNNMTVYEKLDFLGLPYELERFIK